MARKVVEVIPARIHRHKATGRRVSVHGAVPWWSDAERAEWETVQVGWTWRNADGTVGLGRVPAATREEAEAVMAQVNAL